MYEQYSSQEFEEKYTYSGSLGTFWTPEKTAFRLWAPTAEAVSICLYRSGDPGADDLLAQLRMQPDICGTWAAERFGNLNGIYYTYLVTVDGQPREVCDPYAKTTGINGCRAMILDMASVNPLQWDTDADPHAGKSITDAVLYELHIRDLSADPSAHIANKGKFLGLTETGTKTRGGHPTGLDHIKALGVTHVHLLPMYDFGFTDESQPHPQYNWGYDPVNYNVPEGSYATDPFHGAVRVAEVKRMIKALHDNGLSVVMDVVYNHVYDAGAFCFNQIVPGYFSRISSDGKYSNGSFCGNDTASERSMVRKYIVDSVCYWADEYHMDGFRFDIASLIDTVTINEIMTAVHRKHPNVIFYGEGWDMKTELTKPGVRLAVQANSAMVPGFGFFSDTIRDLLRGTTFESTAPGFVAGAVVPKEALEACFMGMPSWAAQPDQCVNYASCHDNTTLFDRIALTAPDAPVETRIRMNNLAAAFYMLSQGVPFLQAGEEMLRTKPGKHGGFDDNSYRSPDSVNSLKWATLDKSEYQDVLSYYKGLIAFRKAHGALRLSTREDVQRHVHPVYCENEHCVAFRIDEPEGEIFAVFNADAQPVPIALPEGHWNVNIRDSRAGTETTETLSGTVSVSPISAMVLTRRKAIEVVAGLIWDKDKFLICQRPENKARGLLWEFPGGKVEAGETLPQALRRECMEELAVKLDVRDRFMQVEHKYPDIFIRLTLFHCVISEGVPQALEHKALCWIHPSETKNFTFCPADTDILKEIDRVYGGKKPL
ncbi:MAG: type I pullulanase [Clostridiales bacterium]|nr:type I pullulanase [Clostridiales bacterium]